MTELPVSSPRIDRTVSFLREFYEEFTRANVSFMAGSLAYSAFVSLFPLLLLLLIAATIVGGEAFADYVVGLTESYLSPSGQQLIGDSLTKASQRTQVSVLTLIVFLWASLRMFRGLDIAFSILYETSEKGGFLNQVKDGLVVLTALTLALFGSIALWVALATVPDLSLGSVPVELLLVPFLTLVFLPMYYVFPDTDLSLWRVIPGAAVAAVGWTGLQAGFQFYVAVSDKTELYGIIGGVILIITWLYFGALIVLVGATVNVVLRNGSKQGEQSTTQE